MLDPLAQLKAMNQQLDQVTAVVTPEQYEVLLECVSGFERSMKLKRAHETAKNFVSVVRENPNVMAKGNNRFKKRPLFPFLYRHHLTIDMLAVSEDPGSFKTIDLKNFRPQSRWTVAARGPNAIFMFRSAEDATLFKLAVL